MWAIDGGIKWNGLAVNGQYFFRNVDNFEADGTLPLTSVLDHGFELVAGGFAIPRKLMVYRRGSMVFGEFRNSWEAAAGIKRYAVPTWVPMLQAILAL